MLEVAGQEAIGSMLKSNTELACGVDDGKGTQMLLPPTCGLALCTCSVSLPRCHPIHQGHDTHLESEEQEECFDTVVPSIHKVAEEEIVLERRFASNLSSRRQFRGDKKEGLTDRMERVSKSRREAKAHRSVYDKANRKRKVSRSSAFFLIMVAVSRMSGIVRCGVSAGSYLEQLHQVKVLSVNVTTNLKEG